MRPCPGTVRTTSTSAWPTPGSPTFPSPKSCQLLDARQCGRRRKQEMLVGTGVKSDGPPYKRKVYAVAQFNLEKGTWAVGLYRPSPHATGPPWRPPKNL